VLLAACSAPDQATNESARQALEDGQFAMAQAHLAEIFTNGNADSETYLVRSQLKLALGDGHSALAAIEQIAPGELSDNGRRIATAHALILQGRFDDALEPYAEADPASLSEQDLRMVLWALREMGNDEAFAAGMDVALDAHPKSTDINVLAAKQLLDLGLVEDAALFADVAFEQSPDHYEVRLLQGRVAIAEDDLEQALDHYSEASALRPGDAVPVANIAGLQLDLGRVDEAKKTLAPALVAHPDFALLQWKRARLGLAMDDLETARSALEKARRTFRGETEFTLLSAQVEDRSGNVKLALSEYQQYLRDVGGDEQIEQRIAELEGA